MRKLVAAILIHFGLLHAGCTLSRNGAMDPGPDSGGASTTSSSDGGSFVSSSSGGNGENCEDGVDNDDDDLVDCADPDCNVGWECVPAAPSGWGGHYRPDSGAFPLTTGVTCDDGTTPETVFHVPGGPATCVPCTCGTPIGGCTYPELSTWDDSASCGGTAKDILRLATATATTYQARPSALARVVQPNERLKPPRRPCPAVPPARWVEARRPCRRSGSAREQRVPDGEPHRWL